MSNNPAPRWPAYLLVAVGLGLSAYLEVIHAQTFLMPGKEAVCSVNADFDCGTVAMSRFAVVAGVPLPIWGFASFAAFGFAVHQRSRLCLPLAAFGVVASIALLLEELVNIGSICLMCEGVHAAWLLLLVYCYAFRKRMQTEGPSRREVAQVFGLPAALVVLAFFFAPKYWALSGWTDGVPYPNGVDENGRPWVGAEEPKVVVHEFTDYGCIHCAVGTAKMRARLAEDPDEIRIVRHQQTRQHCKPESQGCAHARAAICAGEQGRFWEMDSWLFLHAPGHKQSIVYADGARKLGLDLDAFAACQEREDVYATAERDFQEARKAKIQATPGYIVDGERVEPGGIFKVIDARL